VESGGWCVPSGTYPVRLCAGSSRLWPYSPQSTRTTFAGSVLDQQVGEATVDDPAYSRQIPAFDLQRGMASRAAISFLSPPLEEQNAPWVRVWHPARSHLHARLVEKSAARRTSRPRPDQLLMPSGDVRPMPRGHQMGSKAVRGHGQGCADRLVGAGWRFSVGI